MGAGLSERTEDTDSGHKFLVAEEPSAEEMLC